MNIVDQLTGRKDKKETREQKMRRDVLFTRLRAQNPLLGEENIDLSEVDFTLSDDELRARIARERGITAEERIDAIDLDEIIIPSGLALRRARRRYGRAQKKIRKKGQAAFHRQQRKARFALGRPSSREITLQRRAHQQMLKDAQALSVREDIPLVDAIERVKASA